MVDNKDFNEELKESIQEELDNETKSENPNIDEEVEEVSEDIKADEKVIDFEELKALKEENTMFKSKTKKLENELEALKDRLLRISSEYENYRKRTDKEKERIYTDACEDVLIKMLPVLDNLERALAVDGTVEDLKKGMVTYKNDKFGNIHTVIGKVSFDEKKLAENLSYVITTISKAKPQTVKGTFIENIAISTTMGPGIKLDKNSFDI